MSNQWDDQTPTDKHRPKHGKLKFALISLVVIAIASVALGAVAPGVWTRLFGLSFTKDVNKGSYFFRLKAKYTHGDEPIDFDIVVGCGVTVTSYRDGGSSHDASRDPLFYVKATHAGNGVMLITPDGCQGETIEDGRVPKDFLPGVVWYDKAGDWTLGVAYISEDAFENANSKLKFHGASIHAATLEEWEAFRPMAEKNLYPQAHLNRLLLPGMTAERYFGLAEEAAWDRQKLAALMRIPACRGVIRYRITGNEARRILRAHRPKSNPRYWAFVPSTKALELSKKLRALNNNKGPRVGEHYLTDYFSVSHSVYRGFPTRKGGGAMYGRVLAPTFLPLKMADGVAWLERSLATADPIFREIDQQDDANKGFFYCFHTLDSKFLETRVPNLKNRNFGFKVDDTVVHLDVDGYKTPYNIPIIYENDEYMYVPMDFGLR